jgi:hypothetical protein
MQCVNIVLAAGRGPFGSLTTAKQVGTGMIYGSSALGAVNSPIVMYKERQLTKEDSEFASVCRGISSPALSSRLCFLNPSSCTQLFVLP